MNFSGNYVVVNGYRFKRFNRRCFDEFEVVDDHSSAIGLFMSMKGFEVELISMSSCLTHSKAIVELACDPCVIGKEVSALFKVSYYYDKKAMERRPKGGYLELLQ